MLKNRNIRQAISYTQAGKTNMTRQYLIIIIILIFDSCSDGQLTHKSYDTKISHDFYFEMEFSRPKWNSITDKFSSKDSSFRRRYSYGDTSIHIDLTQQELQTIYSSFMNSDFLTLPDELHQDTFLDKGVNMTDISLFANGQLKTVRCFVYGNIPKTTEIERFEKTKNTIMDILTSKTHYKTLKLSDLVGI